MQSYVIRPLTAPLPPLQGVFDPGAEPFCRRPFAAIDRYNWGGAYRPEARAYAAWDDLDLAVLLCAREPEISARVRAFDGEVYRDSCLECFLKPFEDDERYLNIEVNAAGAALIGLGVGREDRRRWTICPPGMDIRASRHEGGWWAVAYRVPDALIREAFGRSLAPGQAMRGNFYCCDETLHPHFGTWNPVEAPGPDFHRPECFGLLTLGAQE